MANLQNTLLSSGTLTASTSFSSPKLLTNTSDDFAEYAGTVFIPSSVNNPTNYVDLLANNGGYERMYGTLTWTVFQSQIQGGSLKFQLSTYGFQPYTLVDTSGYFSVSSISTGYPNTTLRFTNTVGTVWGDGTYIFNVRVAGLGGYSFSSPYLTERVR